MEKLKFNLRTDLANETCINNKNFEKKRIGNIEVIKTVVDDELEKNIGKKKGIYYMLDLADCDINDNDDINKIEKVLSGVIRELLILEGIYNCNKKGLIIGLGNSDITPDSLGPLVIDNVIVTRHMFIISPNEVSKGISNICALSPGVMGTTGIETSDIVLSILNNIEIDYVIVVDALASLDISRVNKTIQVSNAGISPGSGVGNKRKELSKEVINKPVIAIGVPTVVDALTITINTINSVLDYLINKSKTSSNKEVAFKKEFLGNFALLPKNEQESLIMTVLKEEGMNMMVTPKEVDVDLKNLSEIISSSIDRAVHPIISEEIYNI